jgi:glutaredoxin
MKSKEELSTLIEGIATASGIHPRTASSPVVIENGTPVYVIDDIDAFIDAKTTQYGSADHINQNPGITLFTKKGCGRCDQARDFLRSLDVRFIEIDVNKPSPEVNTMWDRLYAQGFTGGNILTPVIEKNDRLYYDFKDVRQQIAELVSK